MHCKKHLFSGLFLLLSAVAVIAQNAPVASFNISDTVGCVPMTVEFSNNSQNATSYFWDFGDGNTSTLENPTNTYTTNGTYAVSLTISNGTTSNTTVLSFPIVVNDAAVSDFSLSQAENCVDESIQFHNQSNGVVTVLWDFGDGNTSYQLNPNHQYKQAGNYTVSLITENINGCMGSTTKPEVVKINPLPNMEVTVDTTHSCDTNHIFQFNTNNLSSSTYSWDFGDGNTSNLSNPTHKYSVGTYSPKLTATTAKQCVDSVELIDYISVYTTTKPDLSIDNQEGCPPLRVALNPRITTNYESVVWDYDDGNYGAKDDTNYTYLEAGSYLPKLITIDANGCKVITFSDTVTVLPTPDAEIVASDSLGCSPFEVDFSASGNITAAIWDFGDGKIDTAITISHTYQEKGLYSIGLQIIGENGCSNFHKKENWLNVKNGQGNIEPSIIEGCIPLSVDFEDNTDDIVDWNWLIGGSVYAGQKVTHTFDSAGLYDAVLITTNVLGCVDTVRYEYVETKAPTLPDFTNTPVFSCDPITVSFDGTPIGGGHWFWDFGDGDTASIAKPMHTFSEKGTYKVALTTISANGCEFTIPDYHIYSIGSIEAAFTYTQTCDNNWISFIDNSDGAVAWHWDFGTGDTSNLQHPQYFFPAYGNYAVSLSVKDTFGCERMTILNDGFYPLPCDTTASQNNNNNNELPLPAELVDVNPTNYPQIPFDPTDSSQHYCIPARINFKNPYDSTVTLKWFFGDGDSSLLQAPTHIYKDTGDIDVTVIAQLTNGTTDTLVYDNYFTFHGAYPKFSTQIVNNCSTTHVSFIDESFNAVSWDWEFEGTSSPLQNPGHEFSDNKNHGVWLTVKDDVGCKNTVLDNVYTGMAIPYFDYDDQICLGESISFSTNIDGYESFSWNMGDGNTIDAEKFDYTYLTADTFTIELTVRDTSGCENQVVLPKAIIVNNPIADFAITGPTAACGNLTVTPINQSSGATEWFWSFGEEMAIALENPTYTFSEIGTHTISLVAKANNCIDTATYYPEIKVYELPEAAYTFTQSTTCLPITVSFQDSSSRAVTWNWDFGDGATSNKQNPSHIYYESPERAVALTITDSNNCSSTYTNEGITVFQAQPAIDSIFGCSPKTVWFKNQSINLSSSIWSFGDGNFSSHTNPVHTYMDTGNFTISLIATSTSGCVDTAQLSAPIKAFDIYSDFEIFGDNASCAPSLINFVNQSVNVSSSKWHFGDSAFSEIKNPGHVYHTPGVYDITLINFGGQGCLDTLVKEKYVTVLGPIADYTISDTTGCGEKEIKFTDASMGAASWKWSFGDGDTSTTSSPTHHYKNPGTFTSSLIVFDTSGCSDYKVLPAIEILNNPKAGYTHQDSTFCRNTSIPFHNASEYANSYQWIFYDSLITNDEHPSIKLDTSGIIEFYLVASNEIGCADTTNPETIMLHNIPVVDFSADTNNHCLPVKMEFKNQTNSRSSMDFSWDFGNNVFSNSANPSVEYAKNGAYSVQLIATNANGCSDTLTKKNYVDIYDNKAPIATEVKSVTVNDDMTVDIYWSLNAEKDIDTYNVFRYDEFERQFGLLGSLPATDHKYTDIGITPNKQHYKYIVQAVDYCGNKMDKDKLINYNSIELKAQSLEDKITLNWNQYIGDTPDTYKVLRKKNSEANYQEIAAIPSTQTSYNDFTFLCPQDYAYKIMAVGTSDDGAFAFSDSAIVNPKNDFITKQKVDVMKTTVVDNKMVFTEWAAPAIGEHLVEHYEVMRSTNKIDYEVVAELPAYVYQYMDNDVDVQQTPYYYKINVVNTCETSGVIGNTANSILLQVTPVNYNAKLEWTPYEGWKEGVEKYIIERKKPNGEWEFLKEVNGGQHSTIDDFEEFISE